MLVATCLIWKFFWTTLGSRPCFTKTWNLVQGSTHLHENTRFAYHITLAVHGPRSGSVFMSQVRSNPWPWWWWARACLSLMLDKLIMLLQRDNSFVDERISQDMTTFETIALRKENTHDWNKICFLVLLPGPTYGGLKAKISSCHTCPVHGFGARFKVE